MLPDSHAPWFSPPPRQPLDPRAIENVSSATSPSASERFPAAFHAAFASTKHLRRPRRCRNSSPGRSCIGSKPSSWRECCFEGCCAATRCQAVACPQDTSIPTPDVGILPGFSFPRTFTALLRTHWKQDVTRLTVVKCQEASCAARSGSETSVDDNIPPLLVE